MCAFLVGFFRGSCFLLFTVCRWLAVRLGRPTPRRLVFEGGPFGAKYRAVVRGVPCIPHSVLGFCVISAVFDKALRLALIRRTTIDATKKK